MSSVPPQMGELLPRDSTVAVTFNEIVTTLLGQTIKIAGNITDLGSWDPNTAVTLFADQYTASNHLWQGTISFTAGTVFEYKYINVDSSGNATWEADPNHTYTVPASAAATPIVVHDVFQAIPASTSSNGGVNSTASYSSTASPLLPTGTGINTINVTSALRTGGLSVGAQAGIITASGFALILILVGIGVFFFMKRKRSQKARETEKIPSTTGDIKEKQELGVTEFYGNEKRDKSEESIYEMASPVDGMIRQNTYELVTEHHVAEMEGRR